MAALHSFEIQIVCEKCIFNYGDYGCLPVVTFFAFRTLRSSVAFFPGIALFAFRLSVTLVTFSPCILCSPVSPDYDWNEFLLF